MSHRFTCSFVKVPSLVAQAFSDHESQNPPHLRDDGTCSAKSHFSKLFKTGDCRFGLCLQLFKNNTFWFMWAVIWLACNSKSSCNTVITEWSTVVDVFSHSYTKPQFLVKQSFLLNEDLAVDELCFSINP